MGKQKTFSTFDNSNPLKAIRAKCYDCSGFMASEIRSCPIKDCPLYPYRFAKNPNSKRRGNPEALKKYHRKNTKKQNEKNVEQKRTKK